MIEFLLKFFFGIPTQKEMDAMALSMVALEARIAALDSLINETDASIEKLRERERALLRERARMLGRRRLTRIK